LLTDQHKENIHQILLTFHEKKKIKNLYVLARQFYGLWFNLQTVEDGDLESAIQMT
jgi:hypothetical protein